MATFTTSKKRIRNGGNIEVIVYMIHWTCGCISASRIVRLRGKHKIKKELGPYDFVNLCSRKCGQEGFPQSHKNSA